MDMEKILFEEMIKAIEDRNEKECDYLIAKRKAEQLAAAYKAYMRGENK